MGYKSVDRLDLMVGGIIEKPIKDRNISPLVGKTFTCLIARQFMILKNNDYYWYENDSRLRNMFNHSNSLAYLMCKNLKLKSVKANPFDINSPEISCDTIPEL